MQRDKTHDERTDKQRDGANKKDIKDNLPDKLTHWMEKTIKGYVQRGGDRPFADLQIHSLQANAWL